MEKIPIGIYDDPKNQRQELVKLDLLKSNIIVFGSAMSGKTTFIKNILINMHRKYTPETENIYIIDFSGSLMKYRDLSFVCACVDNSNEENIKRLFNKIENRLNANTKILGGINFREYIKGNRPPHTTFIIENFNGFLADKRYEPYQEKLLKICREGLSKGITVMFTAVDNTGGVNQYISNFGQKIAFEMPNDKLIEIFGPKILKPMNLPGRGLININNQVYEFQSFLPFKNEELEFDDFETGIKKNFSNSIISKMICFDGELTIDNFEKFESNHQTIASVNQNAKINSGYINPATVGLDYYDMKPVIVDLFKTPSIAIFGKRQSGKTNLLWLLVESALDLKNENSLRFILLDDGRKQLNNFYDYLKEKEIETQLFTQISKLEEFLYVEGYYDTMWLTDEFVFKDNPFTVFIIQNKAAYSNKANKLMREVFPGMLSESENKWMFIFSDVKNITDAEMRNPFNDSVSIAFLLDNIGEFVGDRGSKTIFGGMDAKELKETYARIEQGDGYFYDIESDELVKLKLIYSEELKKRECKGELDYE